MEASKSTSGAAAAAGGEAASAVCLPALIRDESGGVGNAFAAAAIAARDGLAGRDAMSLAALIHDESTLEALLATAKGGGCADPSGEEKLRRVAAFDAADGEMEDGGGVGGGGIAARASSRLRVSAREAAWVMPTEGVGVGGHEASDLDRAAWGGPVVGEVVTGGGVAMGGHVRSDDGR